MTKKIIIAVVTLCLLSIIVFGFLFLRKQNNTVQQPLIQAIPINASAIIAIHNPATLWSKDLKDNHLWLNLKRVAPWFDIDSSTQSLLSFIRQSTAEKDKETPRPIYLSWHPNGTGKLELLYVIALHNEMEMEQCPKLLSRYFSNLPTQATFSCDNETVYQQSDSRNKINFTVIHNLLIISSSRTLVEQSILQQHSQRSLLNDASFLPLWKTTTHSSALSVLVNLRNIPQFINTLGNQKYKQRADAEGTLAGWIELDASLNDKHFLLNGFISTELNDYLHLLVNQKPIGVQLPQFVPANTEQMLWFGLSNMPLFLHDLDGYLTSTAQADAWHEQQKQLDDSCGVSATSIISNLMTGEFGMISSNETSKDSLNRVFFIMSVQSQSIALEQIHAIVDSFSKRNNKPVLQFLSEVTIDDETRLKIIQLPTSNIPACLVGTPFGQISARYCTSIDNYILFGHTPEALTKYVHTVLLKKTLDNDASYQHFTSNLANKGNLLYFNNIPLSTAAMGEWLAPDIAQQMVSDIDIYGQLYGLAIQISGGSDLLYTDVLIGDSPNADNDQHRASWETFLDTCVRTQPTLITIHDSPDRLLLVQDLHNTLYCINKAGRIVWRKSIDGAILSSIFSVDFYRNNKIQYAFSTAHRIYIIDKLGNFVERYPIDLPTTASAGMAVFDYDNRREYRILIPGIDKRIYLYNIEGNVLKDWQSPQTDNPVTIPVQHARVQDKDFLIIADQHNIYLLNRKGEIRLKTKQNFQKSVNNRFYLQNTGKDVFLVTTDAEGSVRRIYFDGRVETLSFANFDATHLFVAADFDHDKKTDYLFIDKYKMIVYKENKDILFSFNFDHPIVNAPVLFETTNETLIGVVDIAGNQTHLFHADGSEYQGFPLLGATPFCIGAFGSATTSFNVIVGGTNNYLFNYELQSN